MVQIPMLRCVCCAEGAIKRKLISLICSIELLRHVLSLYEVWRSTCTTNQQSVSKSNEVQNGVSLRNRYRIDHQAAGIWRDSLAEALEDRNASQFDRQKAYRGINPFLLAPRGFGSRYWLTFNQAAKLGGHIRKGEKGSIVTFWNVGQEKTVKDADGRERQTKPVLLRFYSVFNLEQTKGIAEKLGLDKVSPVVPMLDDAKRSSPACRIRRSASNRTERGIGRQLIPSACLRGIRSIQLKSITRSCSMRRFIQLATPAESAAKIEQLNSFGSEAYSKEELIAEMGAAMLCGVTSIAPKTVNNSAAYLASWISVLKGDSKLIISAASAAQKAADYIRNVKADTDAAKVGE